MNIAKLIIEGALNGIGFALGAVILSAIFAVFAFLSHNLVFLVLAVLAILTWYGVNAVKPILLSRTSVPIQH
jgi:hypothetical protein